MNKKHFQKTHTLCWDCANATGGCPWSQRGIPVKGWAAEPTKIRNMQGRISSYRVNWCPLFKRDAYGGGLSNWKGDEDESSSNTECVRTDSQHRMAESSRPDHVGCVRNPQTVRRDRKQQPVGRDPSDLGFGIVERAVEDWKVLGYGKLPRGMVDGIVVERDEVVRFFFTKWFAELIEPTGYTPRQIRKALRIPEDALEILERMNNDS